MALAATLRKTVPGEKGRELYSTNQILFPSFHAFHTKLYLEIVLGRAVESVMALAATAEKIA
jgi:hypothetical protein